MVAGKRRDPTPKTPSERGPARTPSLGFRCDTRRRAQTPRRQDQPAKGASWSSGPPITTLPIGSQSPRPSGESSVAAAGEQSAAVGEEGGRPDRSVTVTTRVRSRLRARRSIDGHRAADAGASAMKAAVVRQGHRDEGACAPRSRRRLRPRREHVDLAVGAGGDDLAVGRDRDRVEWCRQSGDDGRAAGEVVKCEASRLSGSDEARGRRAQTQTH